MFIVMFGSIVSGVSFYGPFDTFEDAEEFSSTTSQVWEIISLQKPE